MGNNMNNISQFAFDLGKIMGALSSDDTEIAKYLKEHGVTSEEMRAAYKATVKIAEAFYRKPLS